MPEVAPTAEEVDAEPCGREPRREERLSLPWLAEEEDRLRLAAPGEQLGREFAQGRAEAFEVRLGRDILARNLLNLRSLGRDFLILLILRLV